MTLPKFHDALVNQTKIAPNSWDECLLTCHRQKSTYDVYSLIRTYPPNCLLVLKTTGLPEG
jgi:hypothetical protein